MVSNQNMNIREARSFAAAMTSLAREGAETKGYIVKSADGRYEYFTSEQLAGDSRQKLNVKELVAVANRVVAFARTNIAVEERTSLGGSELQNIESGLGRLRTRINSHPKGFGQLFANFKKIAAQLETPSFKNEITTAIHSRQAPKLDAEDNNAIAASYLQGSQSLGQCKNDKLVERFRENNASLISKLEAFDPSNADNIVKGHPGIAKASQGEPGEDLKAAVKTKLGEGLNRLCQNSKELSKLEQNPEFNRMISKAQPFVPSGTTPIQIVKQLANIDLIEKPENRFKALVAPQQGRLTQKQSLVLGEMASKVDRSKPEQVKSYARGAAEGFFLSQKGKETKEPEGEITLSHMTYLCDHFDRNPDDRFSALHDDLKRSLPFAFEARVLGAEFQGDRERTSVREARIQSEATQLSEKIYDALSNMDVGERIFLPVGCADHATLLMMTKTADGEVEFQHINTGFGNEDHNKLISGGERIIAGVKSAVTDTGPIGIKVKVKMTPERQGEIKGALAGLIRVSHGKETEMKDARSHFKDLAGGQKYEVSIQRREQQSGNCSYRCLYEGVRKSLTEENRQPFKETLITAFQDELKPEGQSVDPKNTERDQQISRDLEKIKRGPSSPRSSPERTHSRSPSPVGGKKKSNKASSGQPTKTEAKAKTPSSPESKSKSSSKRGLGGIFKRKSG